MELWPLVIPACIVCVVAISTLRRERRPKHDDVVIDLRDVERVTRGELQGFLSSGASSTMNDGMAVPHGSLGARLRDASPSVDTPAASTLPIRMTRRRRPLVAAREAS